MAAPAQHPSKLPRDTANSTRLFEALLRRDRHMVVAALLAVVALCWLYLLAGAGTGMYPHEMAALNPSAPAGDSLVSGSAGMSGMSMQPREWTTGYTLLMFAMWWLMMIAMMLPSAAPMVLLHAAVSRNALPRGDDTASTAGSEHIAQATTAFAGGYILIWGAFSVVAVLAQWLLEREALLSPMMTSTSRLLGAGLLLAAGIWQLTPLKTVCLRHCRSPASFVSAHWRPGVGGALRMGIGHGLYCLGCCWFLMALLFYAGVMNLIWIVGLAAFVLAEKLLPAGVAFAKVTGVVLIAWGVWYGSTAF